MVEQTEGLQNGEIEPQSQQEAEEILVGRPLTMDYRPNRHVLFSISDDGRFPGWQMLTDVERMLLHPAVIHPLTYYKSGISNVGFEVEAASPEMQMLVEETLDYFWENCLDQIQLSYDYGWCGYEVVYRGAEGGLVFDGLIEAHPLDCWALTLDGKMVGLSVKGSWHAGFISPVGGEEHRLWCGGHWPAKGLWLVHNKRWDRFYGRSQLYGGWRPWRRLATKDGAEEVVDGAYYRLGYQGPEIGYPPEDFKKKGGGGVDYDAARVEARGMAEQAKAGFSIAIPTSFHPNGQPKWYVNWPQQSFNGTGLLDYYRSLEIQISKGVGVPPELLESGDSGSGWSGRKIPLLGFYQSQTRIARNILKTFMRQVMIPLLHWNFGDDAWAKAKVELVMPMALGGSPEGEPGDMPGVPMNGQPGQSQAPPQGPGGATVNVLTPQGVQPTQMSTYTGDEEPYYWELSAARPQNWVPWTATNGPKKGIPGYKNVLTGHIVVGPRPGSEEPLQPKVKGGGQPSASPFAEKAKKARQRPQKRSGKPQTAQPAPTDQDAPQGQPGALEGQPADGQPQGPQLKGDDVEAGQAVTGFFGGNVPLPLLAQACTVPEEGSIEVVGATPDTLTITGKADGLSTLRTFYRMGQEIHVHNQRWVMNPESGWQDQAGDLFVAQVIACVQLGCKSIVTMTSGTLPARPAFPSRFSLEDGSPEMNAVAEYQNAQGGGQAGGVGGEAQGGPTDGPGGDQGTSPAK